MTWAKKAEDRQNRIFNYIRQFDGQPCPTNKTIADTLGMEKKQVALDILRLEDKKRISITRNGPTYRKIDWFDGATEWTVIEGAA